MKLDVNHLKYLQSEEFRVLQAVELGQRNHEIVPVPLIDSIAGLRHGGTLRCLRALLKVKLVHHENTKYDGYRLTYLGYDYLAIKTLVNKGAITGIGRQIGVGKEADVFEAMNEEGEVMALKLHRLGRTSFRAVKSKRDYLKHRNSFSWLYLSRLAALKEFTFMTALKNHGFPVPTAIESNRHAVLMSLIDAFPLTQVRELENPGFVYSQCMDMMARLAAKGLIHCDFNEFNLLIDEQEQLTLIDFPQMVSVGHGNARELFERDVECIIRFFKKKMGYIPEHDTSLPSMRPDFEAILANLEEDLGQEVQASGFEREHEVTLEQWNAEHTALEDSDADQSAYSEEEDDNDNDENGEHEIDMPQEIDKVNSVARKGGSGEASNGGSPASAEPQYLEHPAKGVLGHVKSQLATLGNGKEETLGADNATSEVRQNCTSAISGDMSEQEPDPESGTPTREEEQREDTDRLQEGGLSEDVKGGTAEYDSKDSQREEGNGGAGPADSEMSQQTVRSHDLPSEQAVQGRVQQEARKLKQSARTRQVNRNAHKAGGKKSRQKGRGVDV